MQEVERESDLRVARTYGLKTAIARRIAAVSSAPAEGLAREWRPRDRVGRRMSLE